MKSILLTTTAIVAFAGAAAADGHITMSWSGSATAGVAREGGSDAVDGVVVDGLADPAAFLTFDDGETGSDAELAAEAATDAAVAGTAAVPTGDFDTYAEINATVVGSVATDNGVTLSVAMSVDAGTGYDFADDDGFDAAKTNGAGLDYVKVDGGAFGVLTFDKNDLEHLVDGDDDNNADVLYTNDFGIASVSFALDVATDSDDAPMAEAWNIVNVAPTEGTFANITGGEQVAAGAAYLTYTAPVAADVQWSARVDAPVGDIATVYAAFDEEGGNAFGGSSTISGVTISASSKLEALEAEQEADRSNTIGASYTMGAITVGGEWNTIEDGNQWSINGAYSANGISVAASTNEGEEWEVTGSYALGSNASLDAGVNYTEDAFVGVSFSF